MNRLLALLFCGVFSLASASSVTLSLWQTAKTERGTLTLLRVQDERCPPRAFCLMSGGMRATVLVRQGFHFRLVQVNWPGQAEATPAGPLSLSRVSRREAGAAPQVTFELGR
ncbi:MAG: hypothetical protein Q4C89_13270 [Deinococcus sp.]|uniref:hypothetical protein n=1 Tax=Deinococcus sp. TaxID=47478 RepID=UPI0026DC806B|nr:hypothetical protein [Deinococcus sp.]MDO4246988.1 hypothetical protein [Deinococcus sp.]